MTPPDSIRAKANGHSTLDAAYRIDELIASGQLVPGQRLVEPDLAEQLGISRGAVREALRYLAGDGVVELLPNRGARIRRLEVVDIIEMVDVSGTLFGKAIKLLAERGLPAEDKAALQHIAKRLELASIGSDKLAMSDEMSNFVLLVSAKCGNRFLMNTVRRSHLKFYNQMVSSTQNLAALKEAARAYTTLVALIQDGRGSDAAALLDHHIEIAISHLRALLP